MTIKLLLLRSGEDVIADINEMVVNERVVGYYLDCPHRAKLVTEQTQKEGDQSYRSRVQLIPWVPLSKDRTIPMVSDWVVSMVEPVDNLKQLFEKRLEQINESENLSDDEQSDSSDSD